MDLVTIGMGTQLAEHREWELRRALELRRLLAEGRRQAAAQAQRTPSRLLPLRYRRAPSARRQVA
jgi:hypothetical protein